MSVPLSWRHTFDNSHSANFTPSVKWKERSQSLTRTHTYPRKKNNKNKNRNVMWCDVISHAYSSLCERARTHTHIRAHSKYAKYSEHKNPFKLTTSSFFFLPGSHHCYRWRWRRQLCHRRRIKSWVCDSACVCHSRVLAHQQFQGNCHRYVSVPDTSRLFFIWLHRHTNTHTHSHTQSIVSTDGYTYSYGLHSASSSSSIISSQLTSKAITAIAILFLVVALHIWRGVHSLACSLVHCARTICSN